VILPRPVIPALIMPETAMKSLNPAGNHLMMITVKGPAAGR
jgi:hypothetical protein